MNKYYGYDSNGEEINESTVEELYRIANEKLQNSDVDMLGEADIIEDSFEYFATGTAFGADVHYDIRLRTNSEHFDVYKFMRRSFNGTMPDFNSYKNYILFDFIIHVHSSDIKEVRIEDADVYDNCRYSSYYTRNLDAAFDEEKLCDFIAKRMSRVVKDINGTISNI